MTASKRDLDGVNRPVRDAIRIAIALFVVALIVTVVWDAFHLPTVPVKVSLPKDQGLGYFAAFYAAAQVVERLMEPVSWLLDKVDLTDDAKKSNRTAVIHSIALLLSAIGSSVLQLHFLDAIGVKQMPGWLDSFATALLIGGGTKPLHDFISYLQQKKDQATPKPG